LGLDHRWQPKGQRDVEREKSALLFWTFPTFRMRLSYTSMLVTHCLKTVDGSLQKAQKYWKKLRKDLDLGAQPVGGSHAKTKDVSRWKV
jgi:hypothetical protein